METPLFIESKQTKILEELTTFSNTKIERIKNERTLSYANKVGKITLKENVVKKGLIFFHCRICFHQDTVYEIATEEDPSFLFVYSEKGQLFHRIKSTGNNEKCLEEFQTGIFNIKPADTLQFHFKGKHIYDFFVICVYDINLLRNRFTQEINTSDIKSFYSFLDKNHTQIYTGSHNLAIVDYARQLKMISVTDITKHLLFEGTINIVLSLHIQQFVKDENDRKNAVGSLNRRECIEINKLSELIYKNPEKNYTVEYLCSISGLAPYKLQEGFKKMHNRTVADFIRNVRIEKAETLISNTDLNISEVVYSIGFASRSYFSKIFKRKYKCTPKLYQKNKRKIINGKKQPEEEAQLEGLTNLLQG